jgi:hypothetical protein
MPSTSGKVYSFSDLSDKIRAFAINNLGTFSDAFGGEGGRSFWGGSTQDNVLGLTQRETGVHYLFDFAPMWEGGIGSVDQFYGESYEYVMVGTMVRGPLAKSTLDLPGGAYLSLTEEDDYTIADNGDGTYNVSYADADLGIMDSFSVGGAMRVYGSGNFEYALVDAVVDANNVTVSVPDSGTLTVGITEFCAYQASPNYDVEYATDVPFGQHLGNPWVEDLTTADIVSGYSPRTGRLAFQTHGVKYWMFGGSERGYNFLNIVLKTDDDSYGYSHWALGRASGVSSVLTADGTSTGAYLDATGPFTHPDGTDEYKYLFSTGAADQIYRNPSLITADFVFEENDTSGDGTRIEVSKSDWPGGSTHDPTFGPDGDSRTLDSDRFWIQVGMNGFEGPLASRPNVARGRTYNPFHPNGAAQDRQLIWGGGPMELIMYTMVRESDWIGSPVDSAPAQFAMNQVLIHLGIAPGVYRTATQYNRPEASIWPGTHVSQTIIPVVKRGETGDRKQPEVPSLTDGSGLAGYSYTA